MRTTNPIKVGSAAALPAAAAAHRDEIYVVEGGGGVADAFYVCLKASGGAYAWKKLIDGDSGSDATVFGDITVTKITFA